MSPKDASRKRRAGPEDIELGRRLRGLRLQRGMSQSELADGIGLTFQQVQKYEKGVNRVSAGRLERICNVFGVPITYFIGGTAAKGATAKAVTESVMPTSRGAARLLAAYEKIEDRSAKYAAVVLLEKLAA